VSTDQSTPIELPAWLSEAIFEGEPVEGGLPNKRQEERTISALYCMLERNGRPGEMLSAQVYNVSLHGMGMITRKPLTPGQVIEIGPGDGSEGPPVRAIVAHCTQTVQGYKVGCSLQVG